MKLPSLLSRIFVKRAQQKTPANRLSRMRRRLFDGLSNLYCLRFLR